MPPPIHTTGAYSTSTLESWRQTTRDRVQELVPFLSRYFTVTTEYGDPIAAGPDRGKPHYGVDYGTPLGTHLYSPGTGIVLNDTDNPSRGSTTGGEDDHTVTVDYGGGIIMQFAHLNKVHVKPGDVIAPGDWIADTGNAGIGTGAHLHVAAWKAGKIVDPREFFDPLTNFDDYEGAPGATAGSVPILGPLTGAARGGADAVIGWGEAVVQLVQKITNPETWARVFAIIGGAILAMIGGYMLWQST